MRRRRRYFIWMGRDKIVRINEQQNGAARLATSHDTPLPVKQWPFGWPVLDIAQLVSVGEPRIYTQTVATTCQWDLYTDSGTTGWVCEEMLCKNYVAVWDFIYYIYLKKIVTLYKDHAAMNINYFADTSSVYTI